MRGDLVFLAAALGLTIGSMPLYAHRRDRSAGDPLESTQRGTFVLGSFIRSWFYWLIGPIVRTALRFGVSPTALNLTGAGFGAAAGVAFAYESPVLAGWFVLLGGTADILDGRVARGLGVASPRGAFLDSTLDRFAEVGVFAGLAVYFHAHPLMAMAVALALGGSLLVSYTRARGESQGVVCKVGIMQRAERLLLLGFAAILDPGLSAWIGQPPGALLAFVVGLIALGTVGTAIYRTVWIATRLSS